ncbi:hypothetical protein EDD18DRAFT_1162754 [Armillaria luteobubalina]|uniref:Uncharacterized protein n=1 Tax=Armillaria luteobubalina TaxID=153913 RepID=A0AA39Q9R6_9AGAR|nr:hypothetical protein EDD18DRAFT_1162754 [Armillaria luteobubalina]
MELATEDTTAINEKNSRFVPPDPWASFSYLALILIKDYFLRVYMGPQGFGIGITTEKDRQIRRLEVFVQAHTARTALVQERLTATQRALDALRVVHAEEMRAEHEVSEGLRVRVMKYQERLTDRVSASKDFSVWPCAQLRVTSFLDPTDLLSSLTTSRDTEQRAHKRTQKAAVNTIAVLEAQLAHREAELEALLGRAPEDLPDLGERREGEEEER